MKTNTKEMNLNEMEAVNGAGLLEWVVTHVALPVVRKYDDVKKTVEEKINEGKEKLHIN